MIMYSSHDNQSIKSNTTTFFRHHLGEQKGYCGLIFWVPELTNPDLMYTSDNDKERMKLF